MRNTINLLFALLLLTSCSVEKVNLSPLSNSFSSYSTQTSFSEQTYKSMERVNYLSEITNTLTEFPVFKNQKLNAEIYKMKLHISDYIYSIKQNNSAEQTKAYNNYTNSYKTIQTLKTGLPKDDLELLNRYLAKIKTNISLIDSFDSAESK